MDRAHTARFTRAAPKKTFRNRAAAARSRSPTGRALRTISSGWRRKPERRPRKELGWHQRASRVIPPASRTAARSVRGRDRRALGFGSGFLKRVHSLKCSWLKMWSMQKQW